MASRRTMAWGRHDDGNRQSQPLPVFRPANQGPFTSQGWPRALTCLIDGGLQLYALFALPLHLTCSLAPGNLPDREIKKSGEGRFQVA